jgi:hypothetical protein
MRVRLTLIALASLIAAALCIAGCGGSTAPGKRAVALSILAPTNGATIGVRDIVVSGTVTPASAAVTVGGEPVKVTDGSYQLPMQLAQPSETITITGQADGYTPTSASTTVQYSGAVASAIAAYEPMTVPTHAVTDAGSAPKSSGSSSHKSTPAVSSASSHSSSKSSSSKRSSGSKSSHKSDAKHKSSSHKSSRHKSSRHKSSRHKSSSHKSSRHKSSRHKSSLHKSSRHKSSRHKSSRHKSRSHRAGKRSDKSHGSPQSGRKPEQRSRLTVKEIKRLWVSGCVKTATGGTYKPYCRCTYAHLAKAGALRSRKRLKELMHKLKRYQRTHNIAKLPAFVRRAIYECASKLPARNALVGRPVIQKLPDTSHTSVPFTRPSPSASSTTQSTGGTPSSWASLVLELDRVTTAIADRHPATGAPTDHRSVRQSHPRAAKWWGSPEGSYKWSF